MERRGDYGSPADDWFASLDDELVPLAAALRELVRKAVPAASEAIKWGTPVYEENGMVCGIHKGKGFVALQFFAIATQLDDPDSLLEGTGKKMRHVKIRAASDIKKRQFTRWIKRAASESG